MLSLLSDQLCDETLYSFIKSDTLPARLTSGANTNMNILDRSYRIETFSSELSIAVEN